MAKAPQEIRSLARTHTETAIKTLVGIMRQSKAPASARVQAAQALLDRGWGKPVQSMEHTGKDGGPIELEYDLSKLSDDQLRDLHGLLSEAEPAEHTRH